MTAPGPQPSFVRRVRLDQLALWSVLLVIVLFTFAKFYVTPYSGFTYQSDGTVAFVNVLADPQAAVQVGDQLLEVGGLRWEDFQRDLWLPIFEGAQTGQVVPITLRRGEQTLTVPWVYPGPTPEEWRGRLVSDWFLAYVFWLAAAFTIFLVRPRDNRWWLLVAFNLLTALWLAFGGRTSAFHVWGGAVLLRAAVWLSVPVYLHLHWVFPRPLGRLPAWAGWLVYGLGVLLAAAQLAQAIPASTYLLGFLTMVGGSALLLIAHFLLRRHERAEIGLVFGALCLALLPSIAVSLAGVIGAPPSFSSGALLAFVLLPFAYLYVAFRRRLGWLEVRANRIIAVALFIILVGSALTLGLAVLAMVTRVQTEPIFFSLFVALLTALLTGLALGPFQRFVERRLLGMPVPPTHLLTTYSASIPISPDTDHLIRLLRDEVLPTLMVRQSAMLRLDSAGAVGVLYAQEASTEEIPSQAALEKVLAEAGYFRPPETEGVSPWVRLALPLDSGPRRLGAWLLGRRDPDDYYAASEIDVLKALAGQAGVALANIEQAGRLHAMYQDDIDRTELERARLARDLHDGALSHLASIALHQDAENVSPVVRQGYQDVSNSLRETISNLRPAMLNYGLALALRSLAAQLQERANGGLSVAFELEAGVERHPEQVELHLYRIVQQACENALRHAQARNLWLRGRIEPAQIELSVVDDGRGFEAGTGLDLPALLAGGHHGLAGSFERASLIGATLTITSQPGHGAAIHVRWRAAESVPASPAQ
jgi:signal transduction histidine kinase